MCLTICVFTWSSYDSYNPLKAKQLYCCNKPTTHTCFEIHDYLEIKEKFRIGPPLVGIYGPLHAI